VERKLRVSLDATVLYAGTGWPRWPYEVLRASMTGAFALVLTEQVIAEARRGLRGKAQAAVLEDFLSNTPHEVAPMPDLESVQANRDLVRDDTDVPIALALLEGDVDIFITNDKDWTDAGTVAPRLSEHVQIMLPAIFLRDVLGWTSAELEAIRYRTWAEVEAETMGQRQVIEGAESDP
jgi:hypothetical protein